MKMHKPTIKDMNKERQHKVYVPFYLQARIFGKKNAAFTDES